MKEDMYKKIDKYLEDMKAFPMWENCETGSLLIKVPYKIASFWEMKEYLDDDYVRDYAVEVIRVNIIDLEPDYYHLGIVKTDDATLIIINYKYIPKKYYEYLRAS